jgi:phosphopantothenoylcysteine decarboxylase
MSDYLAVVACGSPLAVRSHDVAAAAAAAGWIPRVAATESALGWLDAAAVERVTGVPPLVAQRGPYEPKRFPAPGAVIVCPATFNSVNKIAAGIMDNYAVGLVCESLATGVPVTVVPMVSSRLWGHPAWGPNVARLMDAGVTFVDPGTGRVGAPTPVDAGPHNPVTTTFEPAWVLPPRER